MIIKIEKWDIKQKKNKNKFIYRAHGHVHKTLDPLILNKTWKLLSSVFPFLKEKKRKKKVRPNLNKLQPCIKIFP